VRVLSLGAGVQSSTLLLMAVEGELELDRAIFADTQSEPTATYAWLETLMPLAERAGIPVDVVTAGNLGEDSLSKPGWRVSIPAYFQGVDRAVPLTRKCTNGYKIRPIQRRLRQLGATAKQPATLLIGISLDEIQRMKPSRVKYVTREWPLIDRRMTRHACTAWLERHGYSKPPKSACVFCPFRDDRSWRAMREEAPADWAAAVAFDEQIRHAAQLKVPAPAFVHRSLVPLPMVDLSTPEDHGQIGMFDAECEGMCGV
jgi:hypothetical protein